MTPKTTGRITKKEIKQDQFVSGVFYLTEQFQKYKRTILGIVGGIVAVIVIIVLLVGRQSAKKTEVQELYGRASVEMRSGNTAIAIIDYRKIIDEHGGSPLAGLACFSLANAYYAQRDFNEAENLYKRYLDEYGDDQLMSISSHWGIAGCLEQKGEFAAASETYRQAAEIDPKSIMAGELLFSAVRTACAAGDSLKAMQAYELITTHFADEPRVKEPAAMYMYERRYLAPPLE
jgi:tetratricopeptide (TPR) repeat protein